MKIDLNTIDKDQFRIKEGVFCGLPALLVNPNHVGTKWTQNNSIFRSSIWSLDGELLSAGLKKFTNVFENPENFPLPESFDGCDIILKIDGSLFCLDFLNGQTSIRTRGTISYMSLENHKDFEVVYDKYNLENLKSIGENVSFLFEITSPNNKIILDYGSAPDLYLIGAVNKENYSLLKQSDLDVIAKENNLKRPERYSFSNNIEEFVEHVDKLKDIEGYCIYSQDGQSIWKVKTDDYKKKHAFKSHASLDKILDIYLKLGQPDLDGFRQGMAAIYDFECLLVAQNWMLEICKAKKEVDKIFSDMVSFVEPLKKLERKQAAAEILKKYKEMAAFAFLLLDDRELNEKQWKSLYLRQLKN